MAKHKKTLEQKKLADMRHHVYSLDNYLTPSYSSKTDTAVQTNSIPSTSYLKIDILKTTIVSLSILAFQIILNILLRNHFIKLPLVSY